MRTARRLRVTRQSDRSAFSLLESLIASAVLAMIVLAVGAAVSSAQRTSLRGQEMILASMAAQDLLSELRAVPYDQLNRDYDGMDQPPGSMQTLDGEDYPEAYWSIGRAVLVQDEVYNDPNLDVRIQGRRVVVTAYTQERDIATVETFIPEPAS